MPSCFLGLGGMVGVLSGMFGVGGGFLMTPLSVLHRHPARRRRCHRSQPDRRVVVFRRSGASEAKVPSICEWARSC